MDNNDETSSEVGKAYLADGEAWPQYFEIRNNL